MNRLILLVIVSVAFACNSTAEKEIVSEQSNDTLKTIIKPEVKFNPLDHVPDDRNEIVSNLQQKIDQKQPLVVHCLAPLCDNDNQGIVPTTESLGDGFSLRTNLYWATSYGMKKYFVKNKSWKHLEVTNFIASDTIMERVAFEQSYENGASVILICDAYRGDMMAPCVYDFLNALAGNLRDSINYKDGFLQIGQEADMMAFNGHNGLMDVYADTIYAKSKRIKDAVVIACSSKSYFNPYFVQTNSYPLLNTTSLLWPGAMILEAVIEKWALLRPDEEIEHAAGDAYHDVKECGRQSARNMFSSGW
ncbi:MAG: hypothetical protein HUJ25_07880 [Crocinitomicaceae bacterium]|nr:hypothetical protein [Crocinitomicaceae bacterium]